MSLRRSPVTRLIAVSALSCLLSTSGLHAQDVDITPDVVYGHKFGLALTMDVFTPKADRNKAAVLFMVSGGWYSRWSPPAQTAPLFKPLTDKGFTVFAVRHGSSPKFSIPEAVADVRRSVRYIRLNADQFDIDPNRLGVFGMSAGGHLSLMLGTASDEGNPQAKDPVARISDRVQSVVAFVAPTDLTIMTHDSPDRLPAYERFPALELSADNARSHSPLFHVTSDDPPTLLLAGVKDDLVPVDHSRRIRDAFAGKQVEVRLTEYPDAGHGFGPQDLQAATKEMVQWFEAHLLAENTTESEN